MGRIQRLALGIFERSGFDRRFLVGLFVAATCYKTFGQYLAVNGSEANMLTSIIAFLLLWVIVPIVLGLVANILTKALKVCSSDCPTRYSARR